VIAVRQLGSAQFMWLGDAIETEDLHLLLVPGQQQSELADRELGRASARDRAVGGSRVIGGVDATRGWYNLSDSVNRLCRNIVRGG
jgi:hypothetical protein